MVVSRFSAAVWLPTWSAATAAAFSSLRAVTIGVGSCRGKKRLIVQAAAPSTSAARMTMPIMAAPRFAVAQVSVGMASLSAC